MWRLLKSQYSEENSEILPIIFEEKLECDMQNIANKLNQFYVNSVNHIVKSIKIVNEDMFLDKIDRTEEPYKFEYIDESKLIKILNDMGQKIIVII